MSSAKKTKPARGKKKRESVKEEKPVSEVVRPPIPMVVKRHRGLLGKRKGRGFSISEIQAAGIDVAKARKMGLRIDRMRGTKNDVNVEQLKTFSKS